MHLLERLERLPDFILRHADAAVLYGKREGAVSVKRAAEPDRAALRSEFDRVGKNIEDNLLEGGLVGVKRDTCSL